MRKDKEIFISLFLVWISDLTLCSVADYTKHKHYHLLGHEADCGSSVASRIVGGEDAEMGQYPWMALLATNKGRTGNITDHCGGAVVSRRYVITAAHCVQHDTASLVVILGEYNLDEDPDCSNGQCAPPVQRVAVEEALSHDGYDGSMGSLHDIALVRTAVDIQFNDFVQSICLPLYGTFNLTNNRAETAGWGSNSRYGTLRNTPVLQRLQVQVVSSTECSWWIKDSQLCAAAARSQDTCNGDSGGPLMTAFSHPIYRVPRYFLIGVLSYGQEICAFAKSPMTVYTNVTLYMEWILDNVKP